ncbi:hypothetical protein N431DRAFT_326853 [Stipitochalara longipes BDJ]|nr:hypothetical protein N431DRAFT_326853 [Stipitochalara longipes BDJ]
MAEENAPTKSRYKQAGDLSEKTQQAKDANVRAILDTWKITAIEHAFPDSIRPTSLGTSAISNLKGISRRLSLAAAQALFLGECKDSNGTPTKVGFGHISKILKNLVETETAIAAAQKSGQEGSGQKTKPRRQSTEAPKKVMTVPDDLVAPGRSIPPPFKFGGTPPLKNSVNDEFPQLHTKGLAITKKTAMEAIGVSKSSAYHSAFGFLENDTSPTPVTKKRASAMDFDFDNDNEKQEAGQAAKKPRKNESLARNSLKADGPEANSEALAGKPGKSLNEILFGDNEEAAEPFAALDDSTDDTAQKLAVLKAIMNENRIENQKLFGEALPKITTSATIFPNEVEATLNLDKPTTPATSEKGLSCNSKIPTLAPSVAKEALASLTPGELEVVIPGLEGDTMVVDMGMYQKRAQRLSPVRRANVKRATQSFSPVMSPQRDATGDQETPNPKVSGFSIHDSVARATAPKSTSVAPTANMGPGQASRVTEINTADAMGQNVTVDPSSSIMEGIQQSEPAIANEAITVPQPSLLQAMAIDATAIQRSNPPSDRLKEHCGWISHGLREVLNTQKLYDLASLDQLGLAQDLQAVFETTMRHLEGDIAWVFKQHGANI